MSEDETLVPPGDGDGTDQGDAPRSEEPTQAFDPDATLAAPETRPDRPAAGPEEIGRYRILGQLGEGGMGVVYEAEQQNPRRRVALKVVRGGRFVDESMVKMFQREAETLGRLKHPNIGAIYESGRTDDGQHFFAMELVRGKTLSDHLAQRGDRITPEELDYRLRLFRQIADAVHYAHQRGVIHRDLKPGNIVVGETETVSSSRSASSGSGVLMPEVKILDFGLARITEEDVHVDSVSTQVGMIKGTLPYMSPEQARGNPDEIDLRADVYALGVILYEMLTGKRPYELETGSLVEAVRIICEQRPEPLARNWRGTRKLDPDLATITGKALEKEADDRYESAAALSEDVHRHMTSLPILARPPSTTYQLRKLVARNKLGAAFAATVLVLLVGFGVWMSVLWRQSEAARLRAEASALVTLGQAEIEVTPSVAIAYALAALESADTPAGRRLALEALWRGPTARSLAEVPCMVRDWSPDGRYLPSDWANFEEQASDFYFVDSSGARSSLVHRAKSPNAFMAFDRDSRKLASAYQDEGIVREFSVPDGQLLNEIELGGPHQLVKVAGTNRIVSARALDTPGLGVVATWEFGDASPTDLGEVVGTFAYQLRPSFAISPDETFFANAANGEIVLRPLDDLASGETVRKPVRGEGSPGEGYGFGIVSIAPDGNLLGVLNEAGVTIYRLDSGRFTAVRRMPRDIWNTRPFFDASGRFVALGRDDGLTEVWDLTAPPDAAPMRLARRNKQSVFSMAFHPNRPWLAAGDNGGAAIWWLDTPSVQLLEGHESPIRSLDFSADGSFLVSATNGHPEGGRLWPMDGDSPGRRIDAVGRDIEISPDGRTVLAAHEDEGASLSSILEGGDHHLAGDEIAWSVGYSPDGAMAAACGGQFDPTKARIQISTLATEETQILDVGDGLPVADCVFRGNAEVIGSGPSGIRLWDLSTGEHELIYPEPSSYVALTPDGRRLLSLSYGAIASQGAVLRIHDLETGETTQIPSHGNLVNHVAVDASGTLIATGDITGLVRIGSIDGSEPHLLTGHEGIIHAVAFDPKGRWLASAGIDTDVRLWPIPEASKVPFHLRPLDEILAVLSAATNYRAVDAPEAPTGYTIEQGPFPGWEREPDW